MVNKYTAIVFGTVDRQGPSTPSVSNETFVCLASVSDF